MTCTSMSSRMPIRIRIPRSSRRRSGTSYTEVDQEADVEQDQFSNQKAFLDVDIDDGSDDNDVYVDVDQDTDQFQDSDIDQDANWNDVLRYRPGSRRHPGANLDLRPSISTSISVSGRRSPSRSKAVSNQP